MKKTSLMSLLVVGMTLLFASWAVAGQPSSACPVAPTAFVCPTDTDTVNFDWATTDCNPASGVNLADKYSIDIYYGSADGLTAIETSYGTSDRTDGAPISQSDLEVPFTDLTALLIPCEEDIEAKVKALEMTGSRKYTKRTENNPWSATCTFQIPCPD